MSAKQDPSPRTQAALMHLRRLRPLDGYAVECYLASNGRNRVRLKRRDSRTSSSIGRPVAWSGYVRSPPRGTRGAGSCWWTSAANSAAAAATTTTPSSVTVSLTNVPSGGRRGSGDGGGASSSSSSSTTTAANDAAATARLDANGEVLLRYGPMALGALLVLRIVLSALGGALPLLVAPVAYMYVSASCPPNDTFDAKRELKRAMRGEHLPEERRPRGILERGLNRLAASVTTELATSLV
ncbi:hypothetical protein ACHAW5_010483 [Stephanodiscus triporus]|uniref:Uncharacterized protein n=1 Tax=Stephanodiscus triporus TaxID=2934178 RepID=A0ABD3MQ56_9STRA